MEKLDLPKQRLMFGDNGGDADEGTGEQPSIDLITAGETDSTTAEDTED